jgi:hypothetical protein
MVGGDTELVMQKLVAIRRDLATLMAGMEASAVRQETINGPWRRSGPIWRG